MVNKNLKSKKNVAFIIFAIIIILSTSFYYVKNINYIMTQDNFSLINTNTIILIGFSIAFIIITITYKTKSIDTDSQ